MDRSRSLTTGTGNEVAECKEKKKDGDSIAKHYPWLQTFDKDVRSFVASKDVTLADVLKMVTELERHVSPEVSKLRTRPNRATKFLTQIRKKISLVKIASLIAASNVEEEIKLFPTYGLLMTHQVNICLASSKASRLGAEKVAADLYYSLKLIFEGEHEYILDVALCSTLDELAGSSHKVGFRLFSLIVEDWRLYEHPRSSLLKYCAICVLLSHACDDGKRVVDNVLSNQKLDRTFIGYVREEMGIDLAGPQVKVHTWKALLHYVKPSTVKAISRSRLVVVSKRDIDNRRGKRDGSGSSDSSACTSILPGTSNGERREVPSSSSSTYANMNDYFEQLGLNINFDLDTIGGSTDHSEYKYDAAEGTPLYSSQEEEYDDTVSSSKRRVSESEWYKSSTMEDNTSESEEVNDDSDSDDNANKWRDKLSPPVSPQSPTVNEPSSPQQQGDSEEHDDSDEGRLIIDSDAGSNKKTDEDDDNKSDSDLEVVSVISVEDDRRDKDKGSESSDDSRSRDEEEADPEENVVPDYNVDSDEDNSANADEIRQDDKKSDVESSDKVLRTKDKSPSNSPQKGKRSISPITKDDTVGQNAKDEISDNDEENTLAEKKKEQDSMETEKESSSRTKSPRASDFLETGSPSKRQRLSEDNKQENEKEDNEESSDSSSEDEQLAPSRKTSPPAKVQKATRGGERSAAIKSATPSISEDIPSRRSTRASARALNSQVTKSYGYDDDEDKDDKKDLDKDDESRVGRSKKSRARKLSTDDEDKAPTSSIPTPAEKKVATRVSTRSTRGGRNAKAAATPTVATRSSTRRK